MRAMRRTAVGIFVAALALVLSPGMSQSTVITYQFGVEFSGAQNPGGVAPWLTATFSDEIAPGNVRLTMSTSGLIGTEFVSGWYFNFNPAKSLGSLAIDFISGNTANSIQKGLNAFKADGDGRYDILFEWNTRPSDRFAAGQTAVYDFSGVSGLAAADFDFLSAPDGGNGPFVSAAHVQGIGDDGQGSGWVRPSAPIPEPGTLMLLGSGFAGLAFWGRNRLRK